MWTILFKCGQYCPHFLDICFEHIEFHHNLGSNFRYSFFISFTMSNVKIPMAIGYSWITLNIKETLVMGYLNIHNCCQPISPFNLLTPFTKLQEIVTVDYL